MRWYDGRVQWPFFPLSYLDGSKGKGEENDAGDHAWHKSRPGERKRMRSLRGACVAAGREEEQAEPASRRCVWRRRVERARRKRKKRKRMWRGGSFCVDGAAG